MRGWHVCPNWHKSCSHLEGGWESDLPGWLSGMAGKGVASSPPYIVGLRPRSVPLPGIASAWNFLTALGKWGLQFRYAVSLDIVSDNLSVHPSTHSINQVQEKDMLNIIEIQIRPHHKVICHEFPNYDINAKYLAQFVLSYRFGKKSATRLFRSNNNLF